MRGQLKLGLGVVAFLIFVSCARYTTDVAVTSTASEPLDLKVARAIITRDEATVTIPVGRRSTWRWSLTETPENQREYQWEVVAPDMGAFGFSLFKAPGQTPKEGTLSDLLRVGQANMWEAQPDNGGRLLPNVAVTARPTESDSAVAIQLNSAAFVRQLRATRPASVEVVTRAPFAVDQRYTVLVEYRD